MFLLPPRCLDIYEYDRSRREKETERVQALRLFRRIASLAATASSSSSSSYSSSTSYRIPTIALPTAELTATITDKSVVTNANCGQNGEPLGDVTANGDLPVGSTPSDSTQDNDGSSERTSRGKTRESSAINGVSSTSKNLVSSTVHQDQLLAESLIRSLVAIGCNYTTEKVTNFR